MIRRRPARRGLSLIEVLLATAIFFIALSGLAVLVQSGTDSARDADWTNRCSRLARSRMAEIEAGTGDVAFGESVGGEEGIEGAEGNVKYRWAVTFTGATGGTAASEVKVRVWIGNKARTIEASVTQVVLNPALMNGAGALTAPTPTGTAP